MSWFIQTLLLDRDRIRSEIDFESNDYNNLLIIENKIKELLSNNTLTNKELFMLDIIITSGSYDSAGDILDITRQTASKYFRAICNKISFSLGGEFTDNGYLEYMAKKYNLDNEQVNKMREHMESSYKHAIRRQYDESENSLY
jgi:hypothetical protein